MWSDACVPQNRNRIMSVAILEFLNSNRHNVLQITHKYQEPGHGCVQEVDAIHSVLDRSLKNLELHSPLAIIRSIVHCESKRPYNTIQLKHNKFKDYKAVAVTTLLDKIPFTKVKQIKYTKNCTTVQYKTSLNPDGPTFDVQYQRVMRSGVVELMEAKETQLYPKIDKAKVNDIKSLYKFFDQVHKKVWEALLKDQ